MSLRALVPFWQNYEFCWQDTENGSVCESFEGQIGFSLTAKFQPLIKMHKQKGSVLAG